jgi:phosphate transport system substrate-binding protein
MRHLKWLTAAVLMAGVGCGPTSETKSGGTGGASSSKTQTRLSGSGSTFIKPIMDKWIAEYAKSAGGDINYQGLGSGAGIKNMTDKAVDFGCTDAFMTDKQLETAKKAGGEIVHVPLAMGAIAVAYNVPGVDKEKPLNFTAELLADIYMGKVTKWNDPKIQELNAGVTLPDKAIAPVHRSDPSGSTSIFTEFLSKHSADWKSKVGTGVTVHWPEKIGIGEDKTAGVAGSITKAEGSIGYIELFYALQNKIPFGSIKNSEGKMIKPSMDSVSAAGAGLEAAKKVPADLRYSLVDAPGPEAYPLSGTTWAVLFVGQQAEQGKALKAFLNWVLTKGQDYAKSLDYAPLPESLAKLAQEKVNAIQAQ